MEKPSRLLVLIARVKYRSSRNWNYRQPVGAQLCTQDGWWIIGDRNSVHSIRICRIKEG